MRTDHKVETSTVTGQPQFHSSISKNKGAPRGRLIKNDPIADEICFLIEGDAAFSAEKFPPTQESIEKAKVQIMGVINHMFSSSFIHSTSLVHSHS